MTTPSQPAPAAAARRETPRVALARLAAATALRQPGVTGLDAGPTGAQVTSAGAERLPGVVVAADGATCTVALYLTAAPTDLHALAARITSAVRDAAATAGLAGAFGDLHVTFTDLTLPDELPGA